MSFYKADTIAVLGQRKDKCRVAEFQMNVWSEMCQLDSIIVLAFGRALYVMDVQESPRT